MSRRHSAQRREINPDPKFNDLVVSKFMNSIMREGKKSVAENIVYGAFDRIQTRAKTDPLPLFHQALEDKPRLKVRPPRLGGNATLGVFASRATYRPNGIGQSVVKLDRVEPGRLWLSGIDLLDGTPVLDIKPYVPYADIVSEAHNAIADAPPPAIAVEWSDAALQQAREQTLRLGEAVVELIEQCLAQDPRPAYQTPTPERRYGVQFWDLQVRWHYPEPGRIRVLEVVREPA